MAQRKLQQEIDKCFKQVDIGVELFDGQYEKYEQATNPSQREKQVDTLKKECKKLQRLRDQIKTWAAGNEVKDKGPLQEKRELIETKMEAFKAVEKEMKTKAFSKEGLSLSTKTDPKEQQREEMRSFLSEMVDELTHQIEASEAEIEQLQSQTKRKKDAAKAERVGELEHRIERHKWHQSKLELLNRALLNEAIDPKQVTDKTEDIKHYVDNNQEVDFFEDDTIYDDLDLDEEGDRYGMTAEVDHVSSQENQSVDEPEPVAAIETIKKKEPTITTTRRPSTQLKSPLPIVANLHSIPPVTATVTSTMKPAPLPKLPETLKYASAAAAAAQNDSHGIGIAPLPPPPRVATVEPKVSATSSPAISTSQPEPEKKPIFQQHPPGLPKSPAPQSPAPLPAKPAKEPSIPKPVAQNHDRNANGEEISVYHLPASLQELVDCYEDAKRNPLPPTSAEHQKLLEASSTRRPEALDAEKPRHYKAEQLSTYTPSHYPQEPNPIFDNPALYNRVDHDALFFSFYYRQGTYQQYLAAKELKNHSWRFHKQYQTWFQRHEEPQQITEDFERGTYRFFDYQSTWMNRRKQDFEFKYRYLEDEL